MLRHKWTKHAWQSIKQDACNVRRICPLNLKLIRLWDYLRISIASCPFWFLSDLLSVFISSVLMNWRGDHGLERRTPAGKVRGNSKQILMQQLTCVIGLHKNQMSRRVTGVIRPADWRPPPSVSSSFLFLFAFFLSPVSLIPSFIH